jgi:hypothetical protein
MRPAYVRGINLRRHGWLLMRACAVFFTLVFDGQILQNVLLGNTDNLKQGHSYRNDAMMPRSLPFI